MENEIARDELQFAVWVAAFAAAGLGMLITQAPTLTKGSWIGEYWALKVNFFNEILFLGALFVTWRMHRLVLSRIASEKIYMNYLNAQVARVMSDNATPLADDLSIIDRVVQGLYLPEDSKKELEEANRSTETMDERCARWLTWQQILVAIPLFVTMVVAVPAQPTVGTSSKVGEKAFSQFDGSVELFLVEQRLPPFSSASATDPHEKLVSAVCETRALFQKAGSPSAIVVGRHDRRELLSRPTAEFASNFGLAQQRADRVGILLRDQGLCGGEARPLRLVLAIASGPRNTDLSSHMSESDRQALLATDRVVDVLGLRVEVPRLR